MTSKTPPSEIGDNYADKWFASLLNVYKLYIPSSCLFFTYKGFFDREVGMYKDNATSVTIIITSITYVQQCSLVRELTSMPVVYVIPSYNY